MVASRSCPQSLTELAMPAGVAASSLDTNYRRGLNYKIPTPDTSRARLAAALSVMLPTKSSTVI